MSVRTDSRWQDRLVDVDAEGGRIDTVTPIADDLGDETRGDTDCALYTLSDGRTCLYVRVPANRRLYGARACVATTHIVCALRADAEASAIAMGLGDRLGLVGGR